MSNKQKSILHLEDDPDIHPYVSTLLDTVASVTSVQTAKEFRDLLAGSVFDMFMLDLVFKDGSGSGMARELRQAYPETPIIILSAHDVTGAIEEADATFIKGRLKQKDFIRTIKKLLR
jgi:DNA-binding NtrC family response regulator